MRLLAIAAAMFIRALNATLRVKHVRADNITKTPQYILAFWHQHLMMMLHSRFRKPIAVMSSSSRDGDIAVAVYWTYGVKSVRGSSTRGGSAALREFIRCARNGYNLVFTPDGPKGPPREVKDGVIFVAQATGVPIVPVAYMPKRRKYLRSWDRMIVPIPFTRAIYLYGDPITIPRDANGEEWKAKLRDSLNALSAELETNFDGLWSS
jgi:lysophospholipid acyltransferase (LPLAT)-like uncharacterized protein